MRPKKLTLALFIVWFLFWVWAISQAALPASASTDVYLYGVTIDQSGGVLSGVTVSWRNADGYTVSATGGSFTRCMTISMSG